MKCFSLFFFFFKRKRQSRQMSFVEKERCNLKGNFTHSLISVTLDTEWRIFCLIYLLYNVELFPVA